MSKTDPAGVCFWVRVHYGMGPFWKDFTIPGHLSNENYPELKYILYLPWKTPEAPSLIYCRVQFCQMRKYSWDLAEVATILCMTCWVSGKRVISFRWILPILHKFWETAMLVLGNVYSRITEHKFSELTCHFVESSLVQFSQKASFMTALLIFCTQLNTWSHCFGKNHVCTTLHSTYICFLCTAQTSWTAISAKGS